MHGQLRLRQFGTNGQGGQPNGVVLGGAVNLVRQPDASSSSHSNSRHSIQHEGHQRCLVFGKLSDQQNVNHHHQHHHHSDVVGVGVGCGGGGGGLGLGLGLTNLNGNSGSHSIRWMTTRNHLIAAWLPALSSPPSLEIYDTFNRYQTYRRSTSGCNKETLLADTKI